jgi:hypothetical protein
MTMTLVLKSGVTGNRYAPFGSGSEGGDSLTDHNVRTPRVRYVRASRLRLWEAGYQW